MTATRASKKDGKPKVQTERQKKTKKLRDAVKLAKAHLKEAEYALLVHQNEARIVREAKAAMRERAHARA